MITGYELIEKMYSDVQEEKLYSTGDSDLDNLLEKAFCEGYEYAQREFGNKANKAAKRAYETAMGYKTHESADPSTHFNLSRFKFTPDKDAIVRGNYRYTKKIMRDLPIDDIKNVDQAINYKVDGTPNIRLKALKRDADDYINKLKQRYKKSN